MSIASFRSDRVPLNAGTQLQQYEVRELVDSTDSELIYEGFDFESGRPLLVREFFPARVAVRGDDGNVRELSSNLSPSFLRDQQQYFDRGLRIARVKHSALAEVLSTWQQNNTVYRASPSYRSRPLDEYLASVPRLSPKQVKTMLGPLLGAVETVHQEELLHLGINSTNLQILQDSDMPLLFGLGETNSADPDLTRKQPTALEQFYAPIELTGGLDHHVGPWSDVYSLAAVFYRLTTGKHPIAAHSRLINDTQPQLIRLKPVGYDDQFLEALDKALSLKPDERQQSIGQLRTELLTQRKVSEPVRVSITKDAKTLKPEPRSADVTVNQAFSTKRPFLKQVLGGSVLVSAGLFGAWWLTQKPGPSTTELSPTVNAPISKPKLAKVDPSPAPVTSAQSATVPEPLATTSAPIAPTSVAASHETVVDHLPKVSGSPTRSGTTEVVEENTSTPSPETAKVTKKPLPGKLLLRISPWGEVSINGRLRGTSPPLKFIQLPAGQFTIDVRNANGETLRKRVTVRAGKQSTLVVNFPKAKKSSR